MPFALQTLPPRPRPSTPLLSFLFRFCLGNSRDCASRAGWRGPAGTSLLYHVSKCPQLLTVQCLGGLTWDVQEREGLSSPQLRAPPYAISPAWSDLPGSQRWSTEWACQAWTEGPWWMWERLGKGGGSYPFTSPPSLFTLTLLSALPCGLGPLLS